ncbi:MAG: type II secretion system minor pseudopilin GspI [Granulosicoccaceae bacterium]
MTRHSPFSGRKPSAHPRGFTLIEVMVALAIVGIAIGALIKAASSYTSSTSHLRDRTFARWVAANRLAEMRAMREWPDIGKSEGEAELARQTWYWRVNTEKVQDSAMRQVEIQIRLKEDAKSSLFTLTSFVGNPEFQL